MVSGRDISSDYAPSGHEGGPAGLRAAGGVLRIRMSMGYCTAHTESRVPLCCLYSVFVVRRVCFSRGPPRYGILCVVVLSFSTGGACRGDCREITDCVSPRVRTLFY